MPHFKFNKIVTIIYHTIISPKINIIIIVMKYYLCFNTYLYILFHQ